MRKWARSSSAKAWAQARWPHIEADMGSFPDEHWEQFLTAAFNDNESIARGRSRYRTKLLKSAKADS
jgi:hypothetical protein